MSITIETHIPCEHCGASIVLDQLSDSLNPGSLRFYYDGEKHILAYEDMVLLRLHLYGDDHLTNMASTSYEAIKDHLEREHQTTVGGGDLKHAIKVHRRAHL